MSSTEEVLLHCYDVLKHTGDEVNIITNTIMEIYANLENIPMILNIAQTNQNHYFTGLASIAIKNIIPQRFEEFTPELIEIIKQGIIGILTEETGETAKKVTVISARKMARYLLPQGGFPEIIQLGLDFINDETHVGTGFYLWSNLAKVLNTDTTTGIIPAILPNISSHLVCDNSNLRILASRLLLSLLMKSESIEIFQENEEFQTAIASFYQNLIFGNVPKDELNVGTNVIGTIQGSQSFSEAIEPAFQSLYHTSLEGFFNQDLPPQPRLQTLVLIVNAIKYKPTLVEDILDSIVETSYGLMSQLCVANRQIYDDEVGYLLFTVLASDEDLCPVVIDMVIQFGYIALGSDNPTDITSENVVEALSSADLESLSEEQLAQLQVFLLVIGSIASSADSSIVERALEITSILQIALAQGDGPLVSEASKAVQELATSCIGFFADSFENIASLLIQRYEEAEGESLTALSDLMSFEPHEESMRGVMGAIFELFGDESIDKSILINCLASASSMCRSPDPELYAQVRDAIVELFGDEDVRDSVFKCIGSMCALSPQTASEDLETFCSAFQESITPELPQTVAAVGDSLVSICRLLPVSVGPFASALSEQLLSVFENAALDESQGDLDRAMRSSIIKAVSALFSAAPMEVCGFLPRLLEIVDEWLKSTKDELQYIAADTVFELAHGLESVDVDVTNLIMSVIALLRESADSELTVSLFSALAMIFGAARDKISEELLESVFAFFVDSFAGREGGLLDEEDLIDRDFEAPLAHCLMAFIVSGLAARGNVPALIEALETQTQSKRRSMQTYALLSIARLSIIAPEPAEEASIRAIQALCVFARKRPTPDIRNTILSAVSYLAMSHPELFNEEIASLFAEIARKELTAEGRSDPKMTAAVAVVCLAAGPGGVTEGDIASASAALPAQDNTEDAPLLLRALLVMEGKAPGSHADLLAKAAVVLLASDTYFSSYLTEEEVNAAAQLAATVPAETVVEILQQREGLTAQFQARLQ